MISSLRPRSVGQRSALASWDQLCARSFSSNEDGEVKKKRSGPVKLKETPRGAKARKETPAVSTTLNTAIPPSMFWNGLVPCDTPPPPFRLADYGEESLYTLVLLRHGESEWNLQNRYTGWCDVNLTDRGRMEARTAGRLLYENQIEIDHAFTSVLRRASFSCNMALNTSRQHWIPVTKSWRLNERHYGALQGYNKDSAYEEMGLDQELVMQMRRAYDVRPPRMENDHKHWHGHDRRYRSLSSEQLEASRAESLKDAANRIMPFFNSVIIPSMRAGNRCMIVSHANTIRTLVKHIDNISDEDIKGMTIPTGIPLLYRLDKDMKPVDPHIELEFQYMVQPKGFTWGTSHAQGFHGVYLGDLERLQDIQKKRDKTNRDWQRIILANIGKSFGWEFGREPEATSIVSKDPLVVETRKLWWKVHDKIHTDGYGNMLLLVRMEHMLDQLLSRKQQYITKRTYEQMMNQLHLDTEGKVVEPFVALADRQDRAEREQQWYENLASELEVENLIK